MSRQRTPGSPLALPGSRHGQADGDEHLPPQLIDSPASAATAPSSPPADGSEGEGGAPDTRAATGTTDWVSVSALHDGLDRIAPSIGGAIARASAHLHAFGPDAADAALAELDPSRCDTYQPYWVVRAEIARTRNDTASAVDALDRALSLTIDPVAIDHLRRVRAGLVS